jgi:transposase-like protein
MDYRLAQWAKIINDRHESRLSLKEYCEQTGLSRQTYYYWQRKLRDAYVNQAAGEATHHVSDTALVPKGFAKVTVVEQEAQQNQVSSTEQSELSIVVGDIRINAGSNYPVDKLSELLKVLVTTC